MFNQPDFAHVDTILEATCNARGFKVIFLPKFHCELNFIEQCWGYAKRIYRLNPESSREDHLERNALAALDAIPLETMRRYEKVSRIFSPGLG
jgi:transposase